MVPVTDILRLRALERRASAADLKAPKTKRRSPIRKPRAAAGQTSYMPQ